FGRQRVSGVSFRSLEASPDAGILRSMCMKFLLIGLSLLLPFTATLARPQANTVRLDVQVTHVKSTEGVPEALITLQGPYSASSTSLYTPSSALTPDMREQID